jgi:hypothetical protein
LIDDVKDSDATNIGASVKKATKEQVDSLSKIYKGETLQKLLNANSIKTLADLNYEKATELINTIVAKNKEAANENNK